MARDQATPSQMPPAVTASPLGPFGSDTPFSIPAQVTHSHRHLYSYPANHQFTCLSPSIHMSIQPSTYSSLICPSNYPSVHLCLFLYSSTHLSISSPTIHLSFTNRSIHVSIHSLIHTSINPASQSASHFPICPSIYSPIHSFHHPVPPFCPLDFVG